MRTVNVGLAQWLTDATSLTETYRSRTDSQERKLTAAERSRQQEITAETDGLRKELQSRIRQAEEAERDARALEAQATKWETRATDYERYREWVELTDEHTQLVRQERELEKQCKEHENTVKWGTGVDGFRVSESSFFGENLIARRPRLSP
jgi:hypothetical protein